MQKIKFSEFITKKELKQRFRISNELIRRYFPPPLRLPNSQNANPTVKAWRLPVAAKAMQREDFQSAYCEARKSEPDYEVREAARKHLLAASDISTMFASVPNRQRKFYLHIGPTNSGKTYHALQKLQTAQAGLYLAPLRLLALEVFDTLNLNGVACSLLTGEEFEDVPFNRVISSTVEMCNFNAHYDVAVIDECQLIGDERRGHHWTKAIFQLDAAEIHLCLAPEAAALIISLLESIGAQYRVRKYKRLVPLKFAGACHGLDEVEPGDALVVFSRKKVLALAAALEERGVKTSVIYGWLPPAARREEIRRFANGESSVLVATDAIGMGVSLPIKRVIFGEIKKWDYYNYRSLSVAEIKQIAGRAGRYGKFPVGEVLTMARPEIIQAALGKTPAPLKHITLPFPQELITEAADLKIYIEEWESLLPSPAFKRERMTEAYALLKQLKDEAPLFGNDKLYRLITCPFDTKDMRLVNYWQQCALALQNGGQLPEPDFNEDDLVGCETQYRAYEIYYRLARVFSLIDEYSPYRQQLSVKINNLLLQSKSSYIPRCRQCGKRLPLMHNGSLCDACSAIEEVLPD